MNGYPFVCGAFLALFLQPVQAQVNPKEVGGLRSVAITIDDLPAVRASDISSQRALTTKLLKSIAAFKIPAVGFVNEQKLGEPEPRAEQIALLEAWVDAGLELGNHTYSHPSFFDTPLEEFQREVLRGHAVTKRVLAKRNLRPRYFRHPFLNTGPDLATKASFEKFLDELGYTIAPVTIDNEEWVYAHAYDRAVSAGDSSLSSKIGDDYINYMKRVFSFYEHFSAELLRREPAQILLIHANQLNADYLQNLAAMIQKKGYQFVSLESALKDPAYRQPDIYVGPRGVSWLQRWSVTQGRPMREEPPVTDWVSQYANQEAQSDS